MVLLDHAQRNGAGERVSRRTLRVGTNSGR
jgi:hypothetical protein